MVIYRYIAKKIAVCVASVITISVVLIALGKPVAVKDQENDNRNKNITYTDVANTTGEQHNNGVLNKDRQRNDEYTRYICTVDFYNSWCNRYHFDTECKAKVSECKVRQGIFYYKLQSDGDEHPYV